MRLVGLGFNGFRQLCSRGNDHCEPVYIEGGFDDVIWAGFGEVLYKGNAGLVLKGWQGECGIEFPDDSSNIIDGIGYAQLEGLLDSLGRVWSVQNGKITGGPYCNGIEFISVCGNGKVSVYVTGQGIKILDSMNDLYNREKFDNSDVYNIRSGIKKMQSGESHALALGRQGEVYSWGNNGYGQLGREAGQFSDWVPQKLGIDMDCANDICCGGWMSGFINHNQNELVIWGWTRTDIIEGIPPEDGKEATRIWMDKKIIEIGMGNTYIAYINNGHGVVIDGDLFSLNNAPSIAHSIHCTPWNIFGKES